MRRATLSEDTSVPSTAAGFSLAELTVAIGLLVFILFVVSRLLNSVPAGMSDIRQSREVRTLVDSLRRDAASIGSLRLSLDEPENAALKNCIQPPVTSATSCSAGSETALRLMKNKAAVADGTTPVRYSLSGRRCGTAGPGCPLAVRASFQARCRNGAATCRSAETLRVRFEVKIDAGPGVPKSLNLPGLDSTSAFVGPPLSVEAIRDAPIAEVIFCVNSCGADYPNHVGKLKGLGAGTKILASTPGCAAEPATLVPGAGATILMCSQ